MNFLMFVIGMVLICNEDPNLSCVGIVLVIAGILGGSFGTSKKPETFGSPEVSANADSSNYEI